MTQAWFRTFSAFALCPLPHFPKLTVPWSNPSGPMTWLKTCWPTWASRAARGSSSRYTAALLYTARARLSRCFWPPERVMPCGHERGAGTDLHLLGEALGTGAMSAHQSEPRLTGPLLYRPLQLKTHALRPTSPPPPPPSLTPPLSSQASWTYLHPLPPPLIQPSSRMPVTPLWPNPGAAFQSSFSSLYHSFHLYLLHGYCALAVF